MTKPKRHLGKHIVVGQSLDIYGDKKRAKQTKVIEWLLFLFVLGIWGFEVIKFLDMFLK